MVEQLNPELESFLMNWLQEDNRRILPEMMLKEEWLKLDGKRMTREDSTRIVADWLHEQRKGASK